MTPADYDALDNGEKVVLSNVDGDMITIEARGELPRLHPQSAARLDNVRGSNPDHLELIGDQLYVTDGGRNLVWEADIHTGAFGPLAAFDPVPNPTGVGPPFSRPCQPGFVSSMGNCLSRSSAGSPFCLAPPSSSSLIRAPARAGVLAGLRAAIDVLIGNDEDTSLFVLEHGSGHCCRPSAVLARSRARMPPVPRCWQTVWVARRRWSAMSAVACSTSPSW